MADSALHSGQIMYSMESILAERTDMSAQDDIREPLATYERSLDTSDAGLVAQCYTDDGIFMPTTLPTARGADMEEAYGRIFGQISLDVAFTIDELQITGEDTAYALTRSNGTQTILATGTQSAESNREDLHLSPERRRLEDRTLLVRQGRVTARFTVRFIRRRTVPERLQTHTVVRRAGP